MWPLFGAAAGLKRHKSARRWPTPLGSHAAQPPVLGGSLRVDEVVTKRRRAGWVEYRDPRSTSLSSVKWQRTSEPRRMLSLLQTLKCAMAQQF